MILVSKNKERSLKKVKYYISIYYCQIFVHLKKLFNQTIVLNVLLVMKTLFMRFKWKILLMLLKINFKDHNFSNSSIKFLNYILATGMDILATV